MYWKEMDRFARQLEGKRSIELIEKGSIKADLRFLAMVIG